MKKVELLLVGLSVLAFIMNYFHLPSSQLLIIFSLFSISLVYFYLGFALFNDIRFRRIFKKESYNGISKNRIIGGVGVGLALSFSAIGILFKFQSWPGASEQLGIGLLGLVIVTVISLIKIKKSTNNYYPNILKRAVCFGTVCAFLVVIPTGSWLNWKYPNNPEYVNAVLNARANPDNQELWDKVTQEREKMNNDLNK